MASVTVRGGVALRQQIDVRGRTLVADEPAELGGQDEGPSPYELLLGALGACTAMTLRLYARRKGWPLNQVEVTLRQERIHAVDCAECETREGWIDAIDKEIVVTGDLTPEQLTRLGEIAH